MRGAVPRRPSFPLALAFLAALCAPAASAAVIWNKVYSGFSSPVEITNAHDGSQRIFVVQQSGKIRIIKGGAVLATPFIDLGATGLDAIAAGGEQGLLGIAFHPQYATNGQFYVNYTRKSDGATVIARYLASAGNADVADPSSGTILLTIAQPEANHNGGAVKFGPDGFLYIGMGDGGGGNDQHGTIGNGQDKSTLLGKILRIDVDNGGANPYAIPPGNPYASGVGGRREIFAIGVRNPWRMSFDRATGDFWFGDVGQGAVEEVDMLPAGTGAGTNFGWRIMEGSSCTGLASPPIPCNDASLKLPIVEYTHALGCSVTGGYVYRGAAVPALAGQYLYGDFCTGRIWAAQRVGAGPWAAAELGSTGYSVSTFGEDEAGELYFANYANGDIYQFADSAANTPILVAPAGTLAFGNVALGSSSAAQVFNITNGGGGTLSITSLTSGGLNPAEFARSGTCAPGSMLAASQSCTMSYAFTPAQLGSRSANLTIATNAGNRTINLAGTGVAVPAPVLSVSASALAFGSVNVGSNSAAQTLTISNAGTGTLTLTTLTGGGANPGDFLRTGTCANGISLTAAQSCLLVYTFSPAAVGARASSLSIVSSAGSATVNLDGTGVTLPPPGISVAPTALDFASILVGMDSPAQTVTVSNSGAAAVTLTSITLQGANPSDFVLTSTCAPGMALAAGATCTASVSFRPLVVAVRTASLVVTYGSAGMTVSVPLTGAGTTTASDVVDVIEYYHAGLDHYFMTPLSVEIAVLDAGRFAGWVRTQESFKAWSTRHIGTSPVCRYYMPPIAGDSHFFSASPTECAVAPVLFPSFVLESLEVMHAVLPDEVSGACPASTTPIYRVWNKRADSNHRYLRNRVLRDAMVARGYVAEGYGPDAVAMCGP